MNPNEECEICSLCEMRKIGEGISKKEVRHAEMGDKVDFIREL